MPGPTANRRDSEEIKQKTESFSVRVENDSMLQPADGQEEEVPRIQSPRSVGAITSGKSDKNILSNKASGKASHFQASRFSADSGKDKLSNHSSQDFALFPGGDDDLAKDCGIFNIELSK